MIQCIRALVKNFEFSETHGGVKPIGHGIPINNGSCHHQFMTAAAEQARKEREAVRNKDDKPKSGRRPKPVSDIPADNKQYNFTDPESKIMKVSNKGWDQCANAQAAVDSHKQIIVACDVTNETNDKQQFEPMLQKAQQNLGKDKRIKAASTDTGYYSESNIEYAEDKQIDAYIATEKVKHNAPAVQAPRTRMPKDLTVKRRFWQREFGPNLGGYLNSNKGFWALHSSMSSCVML